MIPTIGHLEHAVRGHYTQIKNAIGSEKLYRPTRMSIVVLDNVVEFTIDSKLVETDEAKLSGQRSLEVSLRTDTLSTAFNVFVNLARTYHPDRHIGFYGNNFPGDLTGLDAIVPPALQTPRGCSGSYDSVRRALIDEGIRFERLIILDNDGLPVLRPRYPDSKSRLKYELNSSLVGTQDEVLRFARTVDQGFNTSK